MPSDARAESTQEVRGASLSVRELAVVAARLAAASGPYQARVDRHSAARSGVRMLACDTYDAWLLHWPAGTSVAPHDHGGSSGAFVTIEGELTETRWVGPMHTERIYAAGQSATVAAGVVHDLTCSGPSPAVSVHVYSPPLTTMGLFDDAGTELLDTMVVDRHEPTFVDQAVGRRAHPSTTSSLPAG